MNTDRKWVEEDLESLTLCCFISNTLIDDLIGEINNIKEKYKTYKNIKFRVEDSYGETSPELVVSGERLETDREYERRMKKEENQRIYQAAEEIRKQNELQQKQQRKIDNEKAFREKLEQAAKKHGVSVETWLSIQEELRTK